ncbi:hypothetical protein A0H81_03508 [Grifola frondosa]|uniref:Uncharacterized protein n=1 Tax=Grifola frondosa TaxID=5627 RepID=A0A1C7MHU7_GRIFR|nr:hypothetical protein A0H81_03508 [Grifola frondosa]
MSRIATDCPELTATKHRQLVEVDSFPSPALSFKCFTMAVLPTFPCCRRFLALYFMEGWSPCVSARGKERSRSKKASKINRNPAASRSIPSHVLAAALVGCDTQILLLDPPPLQADNTDAVPELAREHANPLAFVLDSFCSFLPHDTVEPGPSPDI